MPVTVSYPGVYIEEISSGVRTITGVATSIAAFVGTFRKGPLNEAMQIFSMADFVRDYGGLDRFSEATYAIQQFFLNGGAQAWVVRVADDVNDVAPATHAQEARITLNDSGGAAVFTVRVGRRLRGQVAIDPGAWGNFVRVEVDHLTVNSLDPAGNPINPFNLTVSEVSVDGDRTTVLQSDTFRNLSLNPDSPNYVVEVVNQGSRLIQITDVVPGVAINARPAASGTLGGALPVVPPAALVIPADGDALNVDIGLGAAIASSINYGGAAPTTYAHLRPFVEAAIRAAANDATVPDGLKPLLANARVDIVGANTNDFPAQLLVRLGTTARPYDAATTIQLSGPAANTLLLGAGVVSVNAQQFELVNGSDGTPAAAGTTFRPVAVDFFRGVRANRTGMYALEDVDLFNILCIPEASWMTEGDARALYAEAETYVEERRSMLIVDIPPAVTRRDQVQTWIDANATLRHRNAVVYFPRTRIPDPLNRNRPRSLAVSGTAAGLWARTDTERGVWKAPAGTDARLRNVESLDSILTDPENGVLNPLAVNCLRNFPIYSNICWGARTLEGADVIASDWKYLPVRRITLYIEESLYRGTKWVVFEPNDEPLWAQIRLNVGAFMHDLFRKGAFQGTTPRDAYFVKCDAETTTQTDIDNGIVNIEVGFAPLKPAEFVIIKIQQITRSAEA